MHPFSGNICSHRRRARPGRATWSLVTSTVALPRGRLVCTGYPLLLAGLSSRPCLLRFTLAAVVQDTQTSDLIQYITSTRPDSASLIQASQPFGRLFAPLLAANSITTECIILSTDIGTQPSAPSSTGAISVGLSIGCYITVHHSKRGPVRYYTTRW